MFDRLLLIADDLTGSLDTAVQFSRLGVSAFVATRAGEEVLGADATVIAVDIESRHLRPTEAAGRVEQCVREAARAGIPRFYKKTDSTLRGNVGAELGALLRSTGKRELYFVPAFPGAGRITKGGVQYVDGVPLHRSRYAQDAADPVREVSIAAIIASQADAAVVTVPRGADPAPLFAGASRPVIVVFDAETNDDLEEISGRLAALGRPPLLAGCAGFASLVPSLLGMARGPVPAPVLRPPLLVICGSRNDVSTAQVRQAEAHGIRSLRAGAANPARAVAEALRRDGAAMLETGGSLTDACGMVRAIVGLVPVGTLAVFGGDTAFGVVEALGVHGMWPLGEISPGVVISRPHSAPGAAAAGMHFVTKAGGFGPIDVVPRIREALAREE